MHRFVSQAIHQNHFEMKSICFLVDSIFSIGGVQRVTAVIAKELAKDYDVTIVTFDPKKQKDTSLYGLNEKNIHFRFIKYPQIGRIKDLICKAYSGLYLLTQPQGKRWSDIYAHSSFPSELRKTIADELREGDYDFIIGVHAPLAARLATLRPMLQNVKLFGWLHNSFEALFGDSSLYIGSKRKRYYVYQFKKLDKVIVLCQNDAQQFKKYDNSFIPAVIYNPLTLTPSKPSTGESKRFLAIGRFTPLHKGIDLLIDAFHLFAINNKDWLLDIVGEGTEENSYKAKIQKYHLEERINIHPFTDHIQEYYSNAQIYVLSSRWEGMPLVLVEAMSHGLPIITSDLPVCKEILGDFGMFFKNGYINELALKLEEATHIDWQNKSKQAIEIAHQFEVEPIIRQWKEIIEK